MGFQSFPELQPVRLWLLNCFYLPLMFHYQHRAKYQPYVALRQRFWRQYLKQYDANDAGT